MAEDQSLKKPYDSYYDARYFEPLFAIEDKHFWFRSRNQVIFKLAQRIVQQFEPEYRVLEVGCGTGNTLRVLEQVCSSDAVVGMDLFHEGLTYARHRVICPLVQGDIHSPPFKTQFDLIGLFDVLEHLPDDGEVLRALHAMLKPGGYLMLTVPAHMSLWSYFDDAAHHYRRYEHAELRDKLGQTGYSTEFLTHYMSSIFPLMWLGRRIKAKLSEKDKSDTEQVYRLAEQELKGISRMNGVLSLLLRWEAPWLARYRKLPIGTSLLAVARKHT
jgi:SAM-dependent methyltransferase